MPGAYEYTWDPIASAWQKVPAAVHTKYQVALGEVVAGHHELYWIALNPSGANSALDLTDAIIIGGVVVFDHFDSLRRSHMVRFDPPMHFGAGIWVEAFANLTSAIFGYI